MFSITGTGVTVTDYTVAVLEDALDLLRILRDHPEGLTLAQLTQVAGMIKNKVFRILFTFEKQNIVCRDDRGLYHLGSGLIGFGLHAQGQTLLVEVSSSVMDRLVVTTGESIFLGVISGSDALCVMVRESTHSVRLFARVGRRAPLHSGGVPKVLFAFMPEQERTNLIERFVHSGELSGADRAALEQRLLQIQEDGFAIVVDELDVGAHSIAAPIYSQGGQVIAALSIAGPSSRFPTERIAWYVDLVREAAGEISSALGYEMATHSQDSPILPRPL